MQRTLLLAGLWAAALVGQPALAQAPDVTLTRLRLRHAPCTDRRQPALLRHLCLWRPEDPVRLQLLPRQAWRRLPAVGYRPCHDRAQRGAQGERGRPVGAARSQARAGQVRRHQPLSRRPCRPGASFPKSTLLIGKGDWDADTAPSRRGAPIRAVRQLDQGRGQGRARGARQGCVRRRQRDHALYARATRRAITACWSSCRRWAPCW